MDVVLRRKVTWCAVMWLSSSAISFVLWKFNYGPLVNISSMCSFIQVISLPSHMCAHEVRISETSVVVRAEVVSICGRWTCSPLSPTSSHIDSFCVCFVLHWDYPVFCVWPCVTLGLSHVLCVTLFYIGIIPCFVCGLVLHLDYPVFCV